MEKEQEPENGQDNLDDVLEDAIEDLEASLEYYRDEFQRGSEDASFALGEEQWPEEIKAERNRDNRPCLTENRLLPFVHQVVNDIRQSRPSIKVSPVDSKADVETAEILTGIIRNIETMSDAESAYDTAAQNAIMTGRGYIRIRTKYAEETEDPERAFEKELVIDRIANPFSVLIDPSATRLDAADAKFAFIFDDMEKDEFEEAYPDAQSDGFAKEDYGVWCDENTIRIAEYYYVDCEEKEVTYQGNTRTVRIPVVKWCKLTKHEILESTVTEHKYIPIVPVYGDAFFVDGKFTSYSLIHQAKDPQRMYNYWKSASTEIIALQPKAPFIGPEGTFANNPDAWTTANTQSHAFLEYRPVIVQGQIMPAPQRQAPPTGSSTMLQEAMMAAEGIRATLGMFGASIGDKGPEKSGIAIAQKQREGDNAVFHFADNLATAMKHVGRILVDGIQKIYKDRQIMRIIGVDGEPQNVPMKTPYVKQGKSYKPAPSPDVAMGMFQLDTGKYDVVIEIGPSYATQRQEVTAMIGELLKIPQIASTSADLLLGAANFPMAKEIAKRIQATMPPELMTDNPQAQMLQDAMNTVQGLQQQIAQMDAALKAKQDNASADMAIKTAELELKNKELDIKAAEAQAKIAQMQAQTMAVPAEVIQELSSSVAAIADAVQELDMRMSDTGGAVHEILNAEEQKQAQSEPVGFLGRLFGRNPKGETND